MCRGRCADLRPLPAEVGHEIGIGLGAGDVVALSDRIDGLGPATRRERDRMVVDRPEVEGRTVACEVTGIGNRMRTLAASHGQAQSASPPIGVAQASASPRRGESYAFDAI